MFNARAYEIAARVPDFWNIPSLPKLVHCLRNPELWPDGYHWDFEYHNSCAMGLAHATWPRTIPVVSNNGGDVILARCLQTDLPTARRIFFGRAIHFLGQRIGFRYDGRLLKDVTPKTVAEVIDDCCQLRSQ